MSAEIKAKAMAVLERLKKDQNLDKGVDEFGTGIKGRNKRYQQAKVFGKPSDVKTKSKEDGSKVHEYKIPDANGPRLSPERRKMMNTIKDFAEKRYGSEMQIASGKRNESGQLKANPPIEKEPFNVFSEKGAEEEKARQAKIDSHNEKLKPGEKPKKRVDPKPDWRSGKLETQPSPDAAIHEMAHIEEYDKGKGGLKHIQTDMDERWGQSQSKHGHMQQKKTAGEVQPMSMENPLRRQMGLPANRSNQKVKDTSKPVEQTIDHTGPRFIRGKDAKGNDVDYMRQSRLTSPENRQRMRESTEGQRKFHPEHGWQESNSPDARINRRAMRTEKTKQPPQANEHFTPTTDSKVNHISSKRTEKLAANEELKAGWSYRKLQKMEQGKK